MDRGAWRASVHGVAKFIGSTERLNTAIASIYQQSGFPCGSEGKESACNMGDPGSILGSGRSPGDGNGNPLQYSCLENPHGERSLVGNSP